MLNRLSLTVSACIIGALASMSALARPIVPAEERIIPWHADLPACDTKAVLDRLSSRFAEKEATYWHSALQIISYDRVGQYGLRSNGRDYIPRRYCSGRALMNNGKHYWATYTIGEELGIIGFGFGLADYKFGLEWCIAGLDRNWAYGPACTAVRPIAQKLRRGEMDRYRPALLTGQGISRLPMRPFKPLPLPVVPRLQAPPVVPPAAAPVAPAIPAPTP